MTELRRDAGVIGVVGVAHLLTNSPLNLGERISGSALTTHTGKLVSYNLRGESPVSGDGWRLRASAIFA